MKVRPCLVAAAATLALTAMAPSAQAQATPEKRLTQKVALTGTKGFKGSYTIDRFARSRSGRLVAVGTVRGGAGRAGRRSVARRNVVIPATLTRPAQSAQIPGPIPGACQVLVLDLRPITLNLLGLVVRTSRIVVRIDAVPGPGNLLGNLLCGITGILDPATASSRQEAAALNALLALVPRR